MDEQKLSKQYFMECKISDLKHKMKHIISVYVVNTNNISVITDNESSWKEDVELILNEIGDTNINVIVNQY